MLDQAVELKKVQTNKLIANTQWLRASHHAIKACNETAHALLIFKVKIGSKSAIIIQLNFITVLSSQLPSKEPHYSYNS